MVAPEVQRAAVAHLQQEHGASERRACRLIGAARSTQRYQPQPTPDDSVVRERLRTLSRERPRYGYRRLTALLAAEGPRVNHKKVHRLWKQAGLSVPLRKSRKRLRRTTATPARETQALCPDSVWCLDFAEDRTIHGTKLRILCVTDADTRACLSTPANR